MRGYLWVINEAGLVTKMVFDSEKNFVGRVKIGRDDYDRAFRIAAWVLQLQKRKNRSTGEVGFVKENIIYALKGTVIAVLVADREIINSPYLYGYLRRIVDIVRANTDGVVIVDLVEKELEKMLKNLPKPLDVVRKKYDVEI